MYKMKKTNYRNLTRKIILRRTVTALALTMTLNNLIPRTFNSVKILGEPLGVTQAHASAFKFGIAPSVFYNTRVAQGSTIDLKVFLANNSELDDDKPQTLKNYTMNVAMTVKCDMAKEEQNKYAEIIQRGIKIKPPIKRIVPNQKDLVDVSITIPKDVEIGEYRYSLVFTKLTSEEDKKKNANTGNSEILTSIEVPLYLEVYDPANPNKGVSKQGGIIDTYISSDSSVDNSVSLTDETTSNSSSFGTDLKDIVKDIFKYTYTNVTPNRFKENWHDFKHKTYKLTTKHKTYFDVADVKEIPITKALAYTSKDLSLSRYILISNVDGDTLTQKVLGIYFKENEITVELEGGKTVLLTTKYTSVISSIRKQIDTIKANLKDGSLTLRELLDKLVAPESPKWNKGIVLHNKLKNLGNVTAKPVCNIRVTDENDKEVDIQKIPTHFITPNEVLDINVPYTELNKWDSSKYKFESAIAMGSNPANANKVDVLMSELTAFTAPIRAIIGVCSLLLALGTLTAIWFGLKFIIRKSKENKEQKDVTEE